MQYILYILYPWYPYISSRDTIVLYWAIYTISTSVCFDFFFSLCFCFVFITIFLSMWLKNWLKNSLNVICFASLSGKFVSVKGTVVRVSNIKPLCTQMAFQCTNCRHIQAVRLPDGKYIIPTKVGWKWDVVFVLYIHVSFVDLGLRPPASLMYHPVTVYESP